MKRRENLSWVAGNEKNQSLAKLVLLAGALGLEPRTKVLETLGNTIYSGLICITNTIN